MKQILFRKYADGYGQLAMLLPLCCLVSAEWSWYAMCTYITVGGWQTASYSIHAFRHDCPPARSRHAYGLILRIVLGTPALCVALSWVCKMLRGVHPAVLNTAELFAGSGVLIAMVMLVLGPVMAVWYAGITLEEINILRGMIRHRKELQWRQV